MQPSLPERNELEHQIEHYRDLFWRADDQPTRDALRVALKLLQHELEAVEAAAARLQPGGAG